jgi:hypothetical protein
MYGWNCIASVFASSWLRSAANPEPTEKDCVGNSATRQTPSGDAAWRSVKAMLAAFDPESDPLTSYVVSAIGHLVERGFTPREAVRFLALELKLPETAIHQLAGTEAMA